MARKEIVSEELPDPLPTSYDPVITKEDALRFTQINELAALSHVKNQRIHVN